MTQDEGKIDKTKFEIGSIGDPTDPEVLLIHFPIRYFAEQGAEGLDSAVGKCRRLEAIISTMIKQHIQNKAKTAHLRRPFGPDGKPIVVS